MMTTILGFFDMIARFYDREKDAFLRGLSGWELLRDYDLRRPCVPRDIASGMINKSQIDRQERLIDDFRDI